MADLASELEALAFRLHRAGETDLARELSRAMHRAVAAVPGQIRDGLKAHLPDRYAETLDAGLDIKAVSRNSGGNTDAAESVHAQARGKGRKLRRLDAGLLTHPVYGDREHWATQSGAAGTGPGMHSGWFTGPAEAAAPRIRAALEQALADVSAKATSRGT